jgi:pimeloyl-ACP methyl ester carboxylesterase
MLTLLLFLAGTTWEVSRGEAPLAGAPEVLETRWAAARPPGGTYDRIELHRYRVSGPGRAALLYLPGTNMNGEVAVSDEDHNLWTFLARRGVAVFALDYRTRFVPASGVEDFAFMRDWDLEAFVGDIAAAADKARAEARMERLFIAGFSRGVTLAYAYAASEPNGVAGLIALDGFFKSRTPKGAYDHATEARQLAETGGYASDVAARIGWEGRQRLMDAAAADPNGPSLDPRYKSVGEQLSRVLYDAWRPGGLANAVEGMSRPQVLARLLGGYDRYYPAIQTIDGRSLADREDDPRTGIDDAWGKLTVPVLYFGSTGMGAEWLIDGIHSAAASGSQDVTLNVLERYGHLDVLVGENARRDVFEPALEWILRRAR